jgi:catechol 2,3-dioxygenase-like lactoylglutathione lyase family enzyme
MSKYQSRLGWGHININVSNLDRSIAFYKKLGFDVMIPAIPYLGLSDKGMSRPIPQAAVTALGLPQGANGRACIMQLNNSFPKIDLTELMGTSQHKPLGNVDLGLVRICLSSQDLQQDYDDLLEQGVEFLSSPQGCVDGMADIAVCADPDGTLIELIQVYLEKWPKPSDRD